jgi:hypothetical protein
MCGLIIPISLSKTQPTGEYSIVICHLSWIEMANFINRRLEDG